MSNGLLETVVVELVGRFAGGTLKPDAVVAGVKERVAERELSRGETSDDGDRSPSRTSASMARSMFPLTPLSTIAFRCSSAKPMSRNFISFDAVSSNGSYCTLAPKTWDALLRWGDLGDGGGRDACSRLALDESGNLKPNLLGVLGGRGGGVSSDSVLPVVCDGVALGVDVLLAYFKRINRSMAESASSASTGTGGFLFWGL